MAQQKREEGGTLVTIYLDLDDDSAVDALCDALAGVAVNQAYEEDEEPTTKGQLARTLIGLILVAAAYSFAFTWWGAHDQRIGEAFMVWVATPVVNLVAIGMACLQIRFYKQGQEREANS
jgi:hypothetical protein